MNKQRVLFLCTHNSARSQMAEGFLRAMAGDRFDAQSAGTEKTPVNPLFAGLMHEPWDHLITVCDDANERCPFVPGTQKRLHWSFEDPSRASGSDENRLATFRRVRDQIEARLADWIETR